MAIIKYLDENDYKTKERSLRKYFRKTYKYLIFNIYPTLKKEGKQDGTYEVELPCDEIFEKVYGKSKLLFSVRNDVVVLEDILPSEILLEGHKRYLPTYKGIPFASEKDLAKIKIVERILNGN